MTTGNISAAYQLDWDIAQASQNISANTSSVYGRLIIRKLSGSGYWSNNANAWSINIDGQTASGTYTYDFRNYSELMLWSGNVTVTHNADGTRSVGSSGYASMSSPSGSLTLTRDIGLTTIPRASTATFSASPTTGSAVTINTNRASSSFTHDITYGFGTYSGTIATGVATSVSWTPPHTLFNQASVRNLTAGSGAITVVTKNGGTVIGTTTTGFTLTLAASQVPTLTSISLSEAVTAPVNIASVVGAYVQGQSKLNYTFNGAAGIQGSTISSYNLTVGSLTASGATGTTAALPDSGTVSVSATVTDSRGRVSAPKTSTISVLAWAPPVISSFTVERALSTGVVDPNGTYLKITVVGSVSSLMVGTQKNSLTYRTDTSPADANTWTNKKNVGPSSTPTLSTNFLISTYAESSSWDVRMIIRDIFATADPLQAVMLRTVSVASVGLDLGAANAGIGKFWEQGALDVGGDIYANALGSAKGEMISAGGFYADGVRVVTNWDTANKVGVYRAAAGATNAPYAADAFVGHVYVSGSVLIQELMSATVVKPSLRFTRVYNGSTWGKWSRSDGLMIPTAVANGTYDPATGRINLTTGTKKWNVDGVFTTDFRAYRIQFQWYHGDSNGAGFRLRSGGVENATSNYQYEAIYATGTGTPAAIIGTSNQATFPPNAAQGFFGYVVVSEPMYTAGNTNQKRFESQWGSWTSAQVAQVNSSLGNYDTVAYDGFSIYLSDQSAGKNGVAGGSHAWLSVQAIA